ncbi:hypothetical protein BD410DRAFT_835324 [Rickenella mellea]|uniref:Thioredoxin domain-containing protein n=1 Tax=Rickenella mellea TaxID=50990 RepID=A0A4Y7QKA6_9AGAM|nr:hypothetical protein BD410DRAFT_835324 [Rickenella mellea]
MSIAYLSDPLLVKDIKTGFLIFYSSIDATTKEMWCPDCRRVEALVDETFGKETSPAATIVYVGQRSE